MLIKQPQIKLVERTITAKDGREVVVLVALSISEGRVLSAQIVGVKPLETSTQNEVKCLDCVYEKSEAPVSRLKSFSSIVSPFLSLVFFNSQPTRAPNFAF